MICSQCGSEVAAGSAACPNCGAQQPGMGAQGTQAPAPPMAGGPPAAGASGQAFAFDAKRWTRNDQIVGGASLLLLISLFLPWYSVSAGPFSASASGTAGHGYLWIVFILALVIVVYEILKAGFETLPFNMPVGPVQLLLGLTGINLVLVLLAFLLKPGGGSGLVGVSVGWSFGAFLGLICAIVAVVPLALPFVRARNAGR